MKNLLGGQNKCQRGRLHDLRDLTENRACMGKLQEIRRAAVLPARGRLSTKAGTVEGSVLEVLVRGVRPRPFAMTYSPCYVHASSTEDAHHQLRKKDCIDHPMSCLEVLRRTESKSIETIVRKCRLIHTGWIVRMHNRRLPKAVLLG